MGGWSSYNKIPDFPIFSEMCSPRPDIMFRPTLFRLGLALLVLVVGRGLLAAEPTRPQRVLLLHQLPDGHPATTHEYVAGLKILHQLLRSQPVFDVRMIAADEPWSDGPEQLDGADGVVVFLAAGAQWLSKDASRLAAFQRLAERKGGLSCLHWGMGTKSAEPIAPFVTLFGGCHGGPDRKYQVLETELSPVASGHPIQQGITAITVQDEFYYALKFASDPSPVPVMQAQIDGGPQTVAWAWERSDGGRSFGFSGLHYHRNWERPEYRRLVTQGVLWSLGRPIPEAGIHVDINPELLQLPKR